MQLTKASACPYVTAVGATRYINPEQATLYSSGGFSNVYSRPTYQKTAVRKYLDDLGGEWKGFYNSTGRGFPDVAAQGSNFHVIDQGRDRLVTGTSASTPVFAGIIALLNSALADSGKPPMGFLNPWLYGVGESTLTE